MTTQQSFRVRFAVALLAFTAALLAAAAASAQVTETVFHYHTDAIGSVRMITDANGQVVARYDNLPFGEEQPHAYEHQDARKFAGKERDPETGFDYFGARYYSSSNGRFTTVDPVLDIDAAIVDPQRWNRYAYVSNNPFRLIDPDGRDQIDANLARMLELLKAPRTAAGAVRGPLIHVVVDSTIGTLLGEIFGYPSRAIRGGLSPEEFSQLRQASSYEKGALLLGVGEPNAPGIDAVDLTNARGVSLKPASSAANVVRKADDAIDSVERARFYNVQVYIDAKTVPKKDINHARMQSMLNMRVKKIVVFTEDGPVEYVLPEP